MDKNKSKDNEKDKSNNSRVKKQTYSSLVRDIQSSLDDYNAQKYQKVLTFINKLLYPLDKKVKSLTEFKRIKIQSIVKHDKYNRKILRKYSPDLVELFNISVKIDEEVSSDDITNNFIISFTSKLLLAYGYKLVKRGDYLSIIKQSI